MLHKLSHRLPHNFSTKVDIIFLDLFVKLQLNILLHDDVLCTWNGRAHDKNTWHDEGYGQVEQ